nr:cell wall-binding repeat-containing protein [uncultured Peptostreptococcus sp.]
MRKILTVLMATSTVASVSPYIYASEKIDLNIYKEISESKKFTFGSLFGPKFNLNDKRVQDEIASKIDSYKNYYETSDIIIKTYDFIIKTDKYEIGLLDHFTEGGDFVFSIIENGNSHKYNTYKTKINVYDELIKILNSTKKVSIDINDNYKPSIEDIHTPIKNSIEVSRATFARSDSVVLVGKDSVSDALCSASLAGYLNAPILLSDKDMLNKKLIEEFERLNVRNIYTTSGNNVISKQVKDELISKGYKVIDCSGANRYETSNNIAKLINKVNKYVLASGENFNDIPSISPYTYENKIPVLLTRKDNLPEYNLNLLNNKSNILAIGGYKTIDKGVYKQIEKKGIKAQRIAGLNRFETSKLIIEKLYPNAESYIYESDKNAVMNIVTSNLSVKYKKPINIVKDVESVFRSNILNNNNSIYIRQK